MNDAQVQAQSCATPANDESVGVARTNAMLKQGDTFCVFELGSVPEGTKLYTRPQPAKVTQETAVVPDELKEICGLIARIFFYGNFVAETYNERELEKLLRKNGYFAESEDELMEIIQRLPSRNA